MRQPFLVSYMEDEGAKRDARANIVDILNNNPIFFKNKKANKEHIKKLKRTLKKARET